MAREGGGKNDTDVPQDWKVVTFRAAHLSACWKRARGGATPRPHQAEHPELGLGSMYFKRHTSQLILVHPGL